MNDIPSITLDDVNVIASAPTPTSSNPTATALPTANPDAQSSGDVLTLVVGGKNWQGWQRVAVTRSMDTIPANFDVQVTEKYPDAGTIDIKPGDECQVKIGNDLVITGYIDRYNAGITPRDHTVRISGRSKSQDLVDCAAFVGDKDNPSYQIMGGTTLSIIKQLAAPYGVNVQSQAGDGIQIPQFNINLGETAWEIIDRITRYSSMVAYDMPDGSLMLAQAGEEQMASGFVQGVNIESAFVTFTMDQRYSIYEGFMTSALGFTSDSGGHVPKGEIATDSGVPRFRKKIIISEQIMNDGKPVIKARVQWEANRRAGRSTAAQISCDSWRDTAGKLWAPNHIAPINLPVLKEPNASWCIGAVTYTRDEGGQHSNVTLMPKAAFLPEPSPFMPLPATEQDIENNQSNPTAKGTDDADPPQGIVAP